MKNSNPLLQDVLLLANALAADAERRPEQWRQSLRLTCLWSAAIGMEEKAAARPSRGKNIGAQLRACFGPLLLNDYLLPEIDLPKGYAPPHCQPTELGFYYAELSGLAKAWSANEALRTNSRLRKERGTYFTPQAIAQTLLQELAEAGGLEELAWVCDPACGSGALLVELLRFFDREGKARPQCVGVDLDPIAIELARLALWEMADFQPDQIAAIRHNIKLGDALVGSPPPGVEHDPKHYPPGSRPFNWPEQFPAAFAQGGFDLVLCNPPWERIKTQAREVLALAAPAASKASHRAARERLIDAHAQGAELRQALTDARQHAAALSNYLRKSKSFPLSAHGDINTFALFSERSMQLLSPQGSAGLIVPTGLVCDYGHRHLFKAMRAKQAVATVLDFENRAEHFPAVDSRFRFSLIVLTPGRAGGGVGRAATLLNTPQDRLEPLRIWSLDTQEIELVNPESLTLPLFRDQRSAARALALHQLTRTERGHAHEWQLDFVRAFDMTHHAECFADQPSSEHSVPLYEGKLFWQHDGAHASFDSTPVKGRRAQANPTPRGEQASARPRFWVSHQKARERLPGAPGQPLLLLRALTNPTNQRTLVAAIVPWAAVGNSALIVNLPAKPELPIQRACLCGNFNALVLDDLARQKLSNTNLNMFALRQLPLLPWRSYLHPLLPEGPEAAQLIAERVGRLALRTQGLGPSDFGFSALEPAVDENERRRLKAQLDIAFGILYRVNLQELFELLEPGQGAFGALLRAAARRNQRPYRSYLIEAMDSLDQWAR